MRHPLCKDESICELYEQMESCTKMHELVFRKDLSPRCVISPNMTPNAHIQVWVFSVFAIKLWLFEIDQFIYESQY